MDDELDFGDVTDPYEDGGYSGFSFGVDWENGDN